MLHCSQRSLAWACQLVFSDTQEVCRAAAGLSRPLPAPLSFWTAPGSPRPVQSMVLLSSDFSASGWEVSSLSCQKSSEEF